MVVVIYVLGCFSLFWHLLHGFKSAFQSLGINHKRYNPFIATVRHGLQHRHPRPLRLDAHQYVPGLDQVNTKCALSR